MAKFSGDGAVELYYDNSKKFETTANGVAVSNIQNNFGLDLNGVGNNTCIRFMSTGSSPNRGYKINFHSATNVFNAPALTFDRTATDGTHSAHLAGISDDGFHLPDNLKLHLGSTGASGDLQIYHDGSTASILKAKAGDQLSLQADTIWFRNAANSETTAKFLGDGAVELYYDNSKKFETTAAGVTVTGETTTSSFTVNGNQLVGNGNSTGNQIKFARSGLGDELVIGTDGYGNSTQYEATIQSSIVAARPLVFRTNNTDRLRILGGGDIQIPVDNKKLQIGAGQDLEIYHDAQHSRLKSKTGNLFIHTTDSGEIGAEFKQNGSVDLYYDHSKKFETTSTGATVTGSVVADNIYGRNLIINGAMLVWQRGTSTTTNEYQADRFWGIGTGITYARSTDAPAGFKYSSKLTYGSANLAFGQAIELCATGSSQPMVAGNKVTLSFYGKVDSGTEAITANIRFRDSKFSTTNQVNFTSTDSDPTLTTSWQRFTKTFTIPTVGATNTMALFELENIGKTAYFTGFQIELGDVATTFENKTFAEELHRSERYYLRSNKYGTNNNATNSWNSSEMAMSQSKVNGYYDTHHFFKKQMRIAPTVTFYGTDSSTNKVRLELPGTSNIEVAKTPDALIITEVGFMARHIINSADAPSNSGFYSNSGNGYARLTFDASAEF